MISVKVLKSAKQSSGEGAVKERSFKKIESLPRSTRVDITVRLLFGKDGVAPVVKYMQEELKLFNDIAPRSLLQYLMAYKNHELAKGMSIEQYESERGLDNEEAERLAARKAVIKAERVRSLVDDEDLDKLEEKMWLIDRAVGAIDITNEMLKIYNTQKKRVNKLLEREEEMPMLFNTLKDEIRLLATLGQQYLATAVTTGMIKVHGKTTISKNKDGSVSIETEGRRQAEEGLQLSNQLENTASLFFSKLNSLENVIDV